MNTDRTREILDVEQEVVMTNSGVDLTIFDDEQEQNPNQLYTEPKNNLVELKVSLQEHDQDFKIPLKDSRIINKPIETKFRQHIREISNISLSDSKMLIQETCLPIEQRFYTCDVCKESFSDSSRLTKHMLIHNSASVHPFSREVYKKSFSSKKNKLRPMLSQNDACPFTCDFCNTSFSIKNVLEHKSIRKEEKQFTCENCGKSHSHKYIPKSKSGRSRAVNLSNCEIYNRSFPASSKLKRQSRKHNDERPFTCNICAKSFSFQACFDKHKLAHSQKTHYACVVCKKSYFEKSDLIYHLNSHITGHS